MAIATVDDIAAALSVSQRIAMFKVLTAAKAAGAYQGSWLAAGWPGAGSAPPAYTAGSGYTCDDTTTGAPTYANASGDNYLARLSASATLACSILLVDRLWACSGMGFAASTYTVTTPGSLPARITDNGLGCELWVEQYVAAGAASGTLTANYVDSAAGNQSGVIAAVVSAPVVGQLQPVPLANNLGVKQLTSVVNSATWTSGSWGMMIGKRIAEVQIPVANAGAILDWAQTGLPVIPDDACLYAFVLATATTALSLDLRLNAIDK